MQISLIIFRPILNKTKKVVFLSVMSGYNFPDQTVFLSEKMKPWWGAAHLDYAVGLLQYRGALYTGMDQTFKSYNGDKAGTDIYKAFQGTYGKKNRSAVIAYRYGRNKINLLNGEYLKRPIHATVVTENSEAKTAKMESADFMLGAMAAKEAIETLKTVGVDVTNGMQIPNGPDDPIFMAMSFKDKNEKVMQVLLNVGIKELNILYKTAQNFLHCSLVSMCYGKLETDDHGKTTYTPLDPRDGIFVEIENDPYLEKSPIKGARQRLPVNEILARYTLTKEQKELLVKSQGQTVAYGNDGKRWLKTYRRGGDICADVIHIEWRSVIAEYWKLSPKTNAQLAFDPSTTHYTIPLKTETFEANPDNYFIVNPESNNYKKELAEMPKGKIAVIRRYKEDLWEATRIAGCIDVQVRRKFFQLRKIDNPAYVIDMSYVGFLYNTVDGVRVSIYNMIENLDNALDVVMYQILKELNILKGRILAIDRSMLGKDGNLKDIMWDAVNNGFFTTDSASDGNTGQAIDIQKLIQVLDLGFSSSLPMLLQLKDQLIGMMDRLSGINDNREGYSAASETVSNNNASINASRTATEPLFYGFGLFVEKLLMQICETYKITCGVYNKEKGRQILGDAKQGFLEVEDKIAYQDYGVSLQDGGKYAEMKQRMEAYNEFALNTKEITVFDVIKGELAETFVDYKTIYEDALKRTKEVAEKQQAAEMQNQQMMQQTQLQATTEQNKTNSDTKQQHNLETIAAKTKGNIIEKNAETFNKMHIDNNKALVDNLHSKK